MNNNKDILQDDVYNNNNNDDNDNDKGIIIDAWYKCYRDIIVLCNIVSPCHGAELQQQQQIMPYCLPELGCL